MHERVEMNPNEMRKTYVCPTCATEVTAVSIMRMVPNAFNPDFDATVSTMQHILDYEILGVVGPRGQITIEYPRVGK